MNLINNFDIRCPTVFIFRITGFWNIYNLEINLCAFIKFITFELRIYLAHIEGYEEFKEITSRFKFETIANRDKALSIYQSYIIKYNRGEIPPRAFMMALVKTRLIEYYNNVIDCFSIDTVKEATRKKYTFQRLIAKKDREGIVRILDLLDYNLEIEDFLEQLSSQIEEDTKREHLNIRLLKTLGNIKK